MKVKIFSDNELSDMAGADGYYANKVSMPSTGVAVFDSLSNKIFIKGYERINSASASYTSNVWPAHAGGGAAIIVSPDIDGNKYIHAREDAAEQETRKLNLNEYLQAFKRASKSDVLEYGMISKCDELLLSWFAASPIELGSVISHIFIQSMNDKNILLSLLKAISNLSYDSIYPFGQTVAVAALVNKDVEVIEGGIRAFENWGSPAGVSVLENTKLAFDWLELYRQQTIVYLREF